MNKMHRPFAYLLLLAAFTALLSACTARQKKYVIGVSQCSMDSWREKLKSELEQSTYFYDDVELIACTANDDEEQQCRQIDSLVNLNVDLLIISPQKEGKLSARITQAMEKGIPVILFDRKCDVGNYTAFMGADNYLIGQMMGNYAATLLNGKGNIVEIGGEHGSSPAQERHRGFSDALKSHPGIHIVGYEEGDWKQLSGEKAMDKILNRLEKEGTRTVIDLVFGGNDRMAMGARRAMERYAQTHQQPNRTITYLGVDALPTAGGGLEAVRDEALTASAIYPTHGDDLMELALKILKGEPYEKHIGMETSIVTPDNANLLLLQHKEVANQDRYIKKMHARVDSTLSMMNVQRILLLSFIFIVFITSMLLVVTLQAYRTKKRLYEELRKKNEELYHEKGTVERQREELEEQRDQLLDATTQEEDAAPTPTDSHQEEAPKNEFLEKFQKILDERIADPDLTVEDIGQALCLSRVQLYRKVKTVTGHTPVEIIREERLKRAHVLLCDTSLSVSEVAYRVGFSAPSYFTKCYKDYYGTSPSGKQK